MLTIRLQRTGKKNQADFRIVLAEKARPVKKKIVELLGSYNPRKKNFQVKEERVKYWISQRVAMSPTVHNLLITKGLVEGAKIKAFNTPKKAVEEAKAGFSTTSSPSAEATGDTPPVLEGETAPAEISAAPAAEAPASDKSETPAEPKAESSMEALAA